MLYNFSVCEYLNGKSDCDIKNIPTEHNCEDFMLPLCDVYVTKAFLQSALYIFKAAFPFAFHVMAFKHGVTPFISSLKLHLFVRDWYKLVCEK